VLVPTPSGGDRLLDFARRFVGAPYLYGGSTPAGFDCSGLVVRAHELAGITVPRTALEQHAAAQPVAESALRAGDLVFFASRRGRVDHVGIYAGDGLFLHAPRRGRPVGYDRLDDAWFVTRFVGAGRFWSPASGEPGAHPAPD
jgi:cell wall-associated NlpC family hydrolase